MAGTVTVGCKLPNGLQLRAMEKYVDHELVMGGGTREVTKYRETGAFVEIKGNSAPHGFSIHTPGGYALTSGVDSDFWDAWYAQNKDNPLVKKNIIYALPREDSAAAKGKEMAEIKSGFERLDPNAEIKLGGGMKLTKGVV